MFSLRKKQMTTPDQNHLVKAPSAESIAATQRLAQDAAKKIKKQNIEDFKVYFQYTSLLILFTLNIHIIRLKCIFMFKATISDEMWTPDKLPNSTFTPQTLFKDDGIEESKIRVLPSGAFLAWKFLNLVWCWYSISTNCILDILN